MQNLFFHFFADGTVHLDLLQIFKASPFIYMTLLGLSLFSFSVWFYSIMTLRKNLIVPRDFVKQMHILLAEKHFEVALDNCRQARHFTATILASGLACRAHGKQNALEAMVKEGKRCGVTLWQRISLLNDIAVIAPMLGLLGTVLALFYAFYEVNNTSETLVSIFDGLGIAIGTTVAGLVVAIFAMIFYATLKFRIVKVLNILESETLSLGNLIVNELKGVQ